jgi:hypothetical protein
LCGCGVFLGFLLVGVLGLFFGLGCFLLFVGLWVFCFCVGFVVVVCCAVGFLGSEQTMFIKS